ncbi:hypothetical protein [Clostridium sp.]|uniref:hypothetical protein n=1 Tax=Clostridium sp. TaxID=1506 RepID=UPI002FC67957
MEQFGLRSGIAGIVGFIVFIFLSIEVGAYIDSYVSSNVRIGSIVVAICLLAATMVTLAFSFINYIIHKEK